MGPHDPLTQVADGASEHEPGADGERHRAHPPDRERQDDHPGAQQHGDQDGSAAEQAEGEARIERQRHSEGTPDVPGLVEMVHRQGGGHPVRDHHHHGDGERQQPGPGQRRDKPPLLQATQSRAKGSARNLGLGIGWKQRSQ